MSGNDVARQVELRTEATEAIVRSSSRKRLVVAGPGTGKTFTFRAALEATGGHGLALTFIKNLVRDLEVSLGDIADVFTFHAFCKWLIHQSGGSAGLSANFHMYPELPVLIAGDLDCLGYPPLDPKEIVRRLHNLDTAEGIVDAVLERGHFYDAAGFEDAVLRVLRHLTDDPNAVPTYPLIVVDEYQDFSLLETAFIASLAAKNPVLIAGDDDQALYDFKHASAQFIRDLARDTSVAQFPLPYCSRCTQVIVDAVNQLVRSACARGHLRGRLDKEYVCYLPDKEVDSRAYPKIVHASCSVETRRAPYVCRYVAEQVAAISQADIALSWERTYPTALVVGPMHYVRRVHDYLTQHGLPQAVLREAREGNVSTLDAARLLAWDSRDNLGWRILMQIDPPGDRSVMCTVLRDGRPLVDALPAHYVRRFARMISLARRFVLEQPLDTPEQSELAQAIGCDLNGLLLLRPETPADDVVDEPDLDTTSPSIICTSLVGAKGLSAGHVFIVGAVDGELPRDPRAISDKEICEFLVAVSRTRQQCHVVSNGRFATTSGLRASSFIAWLGGLVERKTIDRNYWP